MILYLLLALTAVAAAVAVVCVIPRAGTPSRPNSRWRMRHVMRYRLRRMKLPSNWWEQFERDFAAYVDPRAARARDRERS